MESTPTPSPLVKHESMPESYPSLFASESSTPATMDPSALFSTPEPADCFSPRDLETPGPEDDATDSSDKKPTKKRKSWGQVLPEPKTNLPPRKRAKTDDEKEQRRVERVLRNRRAAQSSRERKRQETEALAQKNKDLEAAVLELQRANAMLQQELKKVRPDLGGAAAPSSNSMTLSQPLFPSHEINGLLQPSQASMDLIEELVNKSNSTPKTVNPASISPALTPVPEEPEFEPANEELNTAAPRAAEASQTDNSTPMTQYPAAVLCNDLQCQRMVEMSPSGQASTQSLHPALLMFQQLLLLAYSSSTTLISLWETRPLAMISMSMRASSPLPPTQAILTSIISLVTNSISISPLTSTNSSTSTSGSSPTHSTVTALSTTSSSSRSKTLRLRTLRKILTCNRQLARPLQDATLEALRLSLTRARGSQGVTEHESAGELSPLPSPERLIALLWAIRTTVRSIEIKDQIKQRREQQKGLAGPRNNNASTPRTTLVFSVSDKLAGSKRKWVGGGSSIKKEDGVQGRRFRDRAA